MHLEENNFTQFLGIMPGLFISFVIFKKFLQVKGNLALEREAIRFLHRRIGNSSPVKPALSGTINMADYNQRQRQEYEFPLLQQKPVWSETMQARRLF